MEAISESHNSFFVLLSAIKSEFQPLFKLNILLVYRLSATNIFCVFFLFCPLQEILEGLAADLPSEACSVSLTCLSLHL